MYCAFTLPPMNKKKGYTFRKFINDLHLWLGIASALVLFIVCLTGTIYTFKSEIEGFIEPDKYALRGAEVKPYDVDALTNFVALESGLQVQRITISNEPLKPLQFSVTAKEKGKRGETLYVDPYKRELLGTGKGPASEFFMMVFKLHRWLLLDTAIGRPIVGWATVIFVLLSISGLILWFPKKIKGWKSLKPGFKIKFQAKWKRINHDLHNALGFYSLLLILVMSFSGLCWSFEWYRDGLSVVLGTKVFDRTEEPLESVAIEGKSALTLKEALAIADNLLDYEARTTTVSLPKDETGVIEVQKNDIKRFNETVFDKVYIDQYSGDIVKVDYFGDKSLGEMLAAQIKPLHLGTIYGMFSKVLYFIVCLIATSLPITGIIIWLNKMKKKKKCNNTTAV